MIIRLILILPLLCSPAFAQETVLESFDDKNISVLNEELRRINATARKVDTAINEATADVVSAIYASADSVRAYVDNIFVWIKFNGTNDPPTIYDQSGGIGIADNGTGDFTVTWDTAFSSDHYPVSVVAGRGSSEVLEWGIVSQTSTSIRVSFKNESFSAINPDPVIITGFKL